MWMVTAAVVGVVVHELVCETRTRAVRVEAASSSDELTSLPSRAAWDERLPQELKRAQREAWQVSVALLVLDGLDELRMREGDAGVERVLRDTAFAWAQQLRGTDLLARYDGDAFAAAFPGCSLGAASQLAERLRELAEGVTVSGGIACWDGAESADTLTARVAGAVADSRGMGGDMLMSASVI
jgi:diguanylate cyclase (GGDEF)-like protein